MINLDKRRDQAALISRLFYSSMFLLFGYAELFARCQKAATLKLLLYLSRALPTALAVSFALICVSVFAQDSRWREFANGLRWDTKTATRTQSIISIWFEGRFLDEQVREGRYRVEINCSERKYAAREFTDLDEKGVPVVPSHIVPQITWQDVVPKTAMEALLEDACATMKR